jgi:hypothetical protein
MVEFSDDAHWVISLAYATRKIESIPAAKTILLEALKEHSDDAAIHYNLACYECQLNDLDSTKRYLNGGFEIAPDLRTVAFDDPDLQPTSAASPSACQPCHTCSCELSCW